MATWKAIRAPRPDKDLEIQDRIELAFRNEWLHLNIFGSDNATIRWRFLPPLYFSLSDNDLKGLLPPSPHGVHPEVDQQPRVSAIHLPGAELRGYLSEAAGNLGQLQILSLRGNHLSGIISPSLANCSQLRALYLYQNDFSGPIPTEIVTGSGAPQQPEVVHPASNSLIGSLPVQIGNLKRLRILDLSKNLITGTIPPGVGNRSLLTTLSKSPTINQNKLHQKHKRSIHKGKLTSIQFSCNASHAPTTFAGPAGS